MTPYKDPEKQKAYMREYQRKRQELFKQFLEEQKKKENSIKP